MTDPAAPLDLAARVAAEHGPVGDGEACGRCGHWLPCPTLQLVARVRALEAAATERRGLMDYRARVYQQRCTELEALHQTLDAIWKVARGHGWHRVDNEGLAQWLSDRLAMP